MVTPTITIFVRHKPGCKYAGDEFHKGCKCRKHLRWSQNGKQFRKGAVTRSWSQAEATRRELENQLSGAAPTKTAEESGQTITQAVDVFIQDKRNQGITDKVIGKYTRELARLREFCESRMVFTVRGLNRELLTHYVATWPDHYPASLTRSKVRERLRSFLRFCYQAEWLARIPQISKIEVDQTPTLPLTAKEYDKLLDAPFATFADDPTRAARLHALIQLMRWSGLAIRDTLTLQRDEIIHDKAKEAASHSHRPAEDRHVCLRPDTSGRCRGIAERGQRESRLRVLVRQWRGRISYQELGQVHCQTVCRG